jgi:hypothetical protein
MQPLEAKLKQAELMRQPDVAAKLKEDIKNAQADHEKKLYEITQRSLEERQKGANVLKTEREVAKMDEHVIDGQVYQRTPATATTPAGPWHIAAGSPTADKLTETQAKTVKFLQRAAVASSQLGGNGSVLAGFIDTAKGKIPIGGNYAVSPEYQRAHSAASTWVYSVLRDESGALLGEGEIANKVKEYFPRPGDSDQVIRDKAFRRRSEEESLYHSLGDRKKVIDDWRAARVARRVPVDDSGKPVYPEGTTRTNNRTGKVQRIMGGHWENEEDLQ